MSETAWRQQIWEEQCWEVLEIQEKNQEHHNIMITVFGLNQSAKLLTPVKKLGEKMMSSGRENFSLACCRLLAKLAEILHEDSPGERPKIQRAVTDIHLVHGGFL